MPLSYNGLTVSISRPFSIRTFRSSQNSIVSIILLPRRTISFPTSSTRSRMIPISRPLRQRRWRTRLPTHSRRASSTGRIRSPDTTTVCRALVRWPHGPFPLILPRTPHRPTHPPPVAGPFDGRPSARVRPSHHTARSACPRRSRTNCPDLSALFLLQQSAPSGPQLPPLTCAALTRYRALPHALPPRRLPRHLRLQSTVLRLPQQPPAQPPFLVRSAPSHLLPALAPALRVNASSSGLPARRQQRQRLRKHRHSHPRLPQRIHPRLPGAVPAASLLLPQPLPLSPLPGPFHPALLLSPLPLVPPHLPPPPPRWFPISPRQSTSLLHHRLHHPALHPTAAALPRRPPLSRTRSLRRMNPMLPPRAAPPRHTRPVSAPGARSAPALSSGFPFRSSGLSSAARLRAPTMAGARRLASPIMA